MKLTLTIGQIKRLVKESTLGIERNLAKVDRAVKKFNEFRKQALAKIGDEGSLYYETGSTLQSGPQYISEMHMEMDGEYVSINYVAEEMVGWNTRRIAQEDRANASDEFEIDNLLDSIKFLLKGVKKALRYYERLNPDNEEEVLSDLEKDDVDEGSLDRTSMDEISRDVWDWYDNHGGYLTDEQLNAVVDGTDENNEVFNGMLRDLGLTDADEEVKDAAYQALREEASTELGIRAMDMNEGTNVVWDREDDEMVEHFKEQWLSRIEGILDYAGSGHDKWNKEKLWHVLATYCQKASKQCLTNSVAAANRKRL